MEDLADTVDALGARFILTTKIEADGEVKYNVGIHLNR